MSNLSRIIVLVILVLLLLFAYDFQNKKAKQSVALPTDSVEVVLDAINAEKSLSNISIHYEEREAINMLGQIVKAKYQKIGFKANGQERMFRLPLDVFQRCIKPALEERGYMFQTPQLIPPER